MLWIDFSYLSMGTCCHKGRQLPDQQIGYQLAWKNSATWSCGDDAWIYHCVNSSVVPCVWAVIMWCCVTSLKTPCPSVVFSDFHVIFKQPHWIVSLLSSWVLGDWFKVAYRFCCGPGYCSWFATRYGLDGPGIESRLGEVFSTLPDRPWGPPSLVYSGYRAIPGSKAAGAWR